jgi:hypothetical protein
LVIGNLPIFAQQVRPQPMTAPSQPQVRPGRVARSTLVAITLLAIISASFTVVLLGSFSKPNKGSVTTPR